MSSTQVDYPCDYVVLAPGGDLSPITDDREADGTIVGRRAPLAQRDRSLDDALDAAGAPCLPHDGRRHAEG